MPVKGNDRLSGIRLLTDTSGLKDGFSAFQTEKRLRLNRFLWPVHTRQQIVAGNGNKVAVSGNYVAVSGNFFGDYSFGNNLLPFSATLLPGVDRPLDLDFILAYKIRPDTKFRLRKRRTSYRPITFCLSHHFL